MEDPVRVLFVAPEGTLAEEAAAVLERDGDGLVVETAATARDGLEYLADHEVDCILSGYHLSDRTGVEFLEAVRANDPDLPFVLWPNDGSEEIASDAISAGVTDYLGPECDTEQYEFVGDRIRAAVDRSRTRTESNPRAEASVSSIDGVAIPDGDHRYRSLAELDALFEHSPDMIDVHDADGRILDVNERLCEVVGQSPDDLIGKRVWDIDETLESADLRDIWDRTEVGERLRFETEYRRTDGSTVPVEVHVVRLDIDHADRFVAISRDISDRKDREAEFRRNTRAMDEAPIGITISEPAQKDNEMIYINEKFEEMTGYAEAEAIGENCRFLQGEETREEPVAEMRAAIDEQEPVSVELRNYRRDGTMFWNRVTIAPVEDESGTITNWVGFQEDITDRKEGERKLQRQNDQLEEFASVVSHDLRNPLNVAAGRLELLREECESEYLDDIAWAHRRMNDLIDDLLTLAREGERIRHPERVDLAALARDCWRNVETTRATISTDIARPIRADRGRLQQLLENLMRNAVEHGGEDVSVTIGELADGFYVADDGPGIPEREREEVFDMGYSTSTDGTGFGLSIVEQIADAHDWGVRVTDGDRGGARFEIRNVTFADD
ncbi:PAS domain S-box protein [Natrinema salsiterrestre]|uniref:histidine kinase n=1 Tax=Natrinema salsiterrestre TaxID=2950540 RepID=A0A9Q4Q2L0_9EURY|nr:PAS domain S-box protein [Natrinema salsiterrestre]MDF9746626.1 PAS domain S-box protein [Natrinema salsiterrestre]